MTEKCGNILEAIKDHFEYWPKYARLYEDSVCVENDITPKSKADIDRIENSNGKTFYVVCYPQEVGTIIAVVSVAISIASAYFLSPDIDQTETSDITSSPNNRVLSPQNKARPNQRIPDIFGTVKSIPDLISAPTVGQVYKRYENGKRVSYVYYCIGKGFYDIKPNDIKVGNTSVSTIGAVDMEVYDPYTNPVNNGVPSLTINSPINKPLVFSSVSKAVNGQTLLPPNSNRYTGDKDLKFVWPNIIALKQPNSEHLNAIFEVGESINISTPVSAYEDPNNPGGPYFTLDFTGSYVVETVTSGTMTLVSPNSVNVSWDILQNILDSETKYGDINSDATLNSNNYSPVGPVVIETKGSDEIELSFLAQSGLYTIDESNNQKALSVDIYTTIEPVDENGDSLGPTEAFTFTISGSSKFRDYIGVTETISLTDPENRYKISCLRLTPFDTDFKGTIQDEIVWESLTAKKELPVTTDYGDVTTIYMRSEQGRTEVSGELNCVVTRKIPVRLSGDDFTQTLHPTNRADEILSFVSKDPFIGGRDDDELDYSVIYDTVQQISDYFGDERLVEFNYTFDDLNTSFEETVATICGAVFSRAYRQGSLLKISFEREQLMSSLLFNHRNKLPGSEKRTTNFGNFNDHDGVEITYIDGETYTKETLKVPPGSPFTNTKQVNIVGVKGYEQAHRHAWRIWNKIVYQNTILNMTCTQEADLLLLDDKVLIADNTRPDTWDGEIEGVNGLELTLSQPLDLDSEENYVIFLQYSSGVVQSIPFSLTSDNRKILLNSAPTEVLSTNEDNYAKCTYEITREANERVSTFLVQEKTPNDNFTSDMVCVNYDWRFYHFDFLQLYMPFEELDIYKDESVNRFSFIKGGNPAIVYDQVRGNTYQGFSEGDELEISGMVGSDSYTKTMWVCKFGQGEGHLFSGAIPGTESFYFEDDEVVKSSHAAVEEVSASANFLNTWVHLAVTYDAQTSTMKLYINGELVSTNTNMNQRPLGGLKLFGTAAI